MEEPLSGRVGLARLQGDGPRRGCKDPVGVLLLPPTDRRGALGWVEVAALSVMPRGKEMGKQDQRGKEQGVASHTGSSSASPLLVAEEDRYQQPMAPSQLVLLTTGSEEGTKAKVKNDFSGRFNLGEVRRTTQEKSCIPGGLRYTGAGILEQKERRKWSRS
ncbi:uncharacterized protein [Aegilops tauschii subsp. strangulata]|uniref:uncharacterized protein isoform X2 n=1 Tax=Aegilops tauschii subsp. strangulata TaxID=200361 RepID=UPI001ABC697C|nr:uncharacterized protein LOC109742361 isoform X2 [Aegilops tauschii subsp. strangulata]